MGQLWTNEMEEHWLAVFEEAANPKDFFVVRDVNVTDRGKPKVTVHSQECSSG